MSHKKLYGSALKTALIHFDHTQKGPPDLSDAFDTADHDIFLKTVWALKVPFLIDFPPLYQ